MSSTAAPVRVPRRSLSRRLLGSSLAEALTTPHGVDRYLELVRPSWSLGEVRAEVEDVRHSTADTVTLGLRPNANWRGFRAGQYVRLDVQIDGVRRSRCYSLAGSEHTGPDCIEISVKAQPDGLVSRFLKDRAEPGMVLGLSQADGDFVLPTEARAERLLLISGGSGITPVMSLLRTLVDEEHTGPITFLHYARGEHEVPYADELAAIAARHPNVRVALACTAPGGGGGELRGRFSLGHARAVEPELRAAETYVCGPAGLIDAVRSRWAEQKLEHRLHVERFTAPVIPSPSGGAGGSVSFARSGETTRSDGRSLLEQAEAAGLSPEFGCRMGICHSCTAHKQAGCVRNIVSGAVSGADEEDIQVCVSVPVGDVVVDL